MLDLSPCCTLNNGQELDRYVIILTSSCAWHPLLGLSDASETLLLSFLSRSSLRLPELRSVHCVRVRGILGTTNRRKRLFKANKPSPIPLLNSKNMILRQPGSGLSQARQRAKFPSLSRMGHHRQHKISWLIEHATGCTKRKKLCREQRELIGKSAHI